MPGESAPGIQEYLSVLRARKWYVIVVAAVALGAALYYSYQQTPIYISSAQVLVRPVNLSPTEPSTAGGFVNMETERAVVVSSEVTQIALARVRKLRLPLGRVSVDVPPNTETFFVNASSPNPASAQATAQAFAESYLQFRREEVLEDLRAATQPIQRQINALTKQSTRLEQKLLTAKKESERAALQIQLNSLFGQLAALNSKSNELILPQNLHVGQVLQAAYYPDSPSSPDHKKTASLALFVGLTLGIGAAFLRDRLDRRLRGRGDLEFRSRAPVLGVIPPQSLKEIGPGSVVMFSKPESGAAEAYRTLRTSLMATLSSASVKSLLISSPRPEEGKSLTTANLGVALAQAGHQVMLVSADLRKPTLHRYFGIRATNGLTDVLAGRSRAHSVVANIGIDNLWLLDRGHQPKNPDSILGSAAMSDLLRSLTEVASFVLLDGSPLLGHADALSLAPLVDGVLLVVDAQRTTAAAVEEARHQLDQVGARVIGAVLNNYRPSGPEYTDYKYGYGYGRGEPDRMRLTPGSGEQP